MSRFLRRLRSEDGSAVVETALMLPIVLMLVFGFIAFTQAVATKVVLETAAREGARSYAVSNSAATAQAKVREELAVGRINPDAAQVVAQSTGGGRAVTVTMPYSFHVPFAGGYSPTLAGSAVFKQEPNPAFR